jgi:hypothetical protein
MAKSFEASVTYVNSSGGSGGQGAYSETIKGKLTYPYWPDESMWDFTSNYGNKTLNQSNATIASRGAEIGGGWGFWGGKTRRNRKGKKSKKRKSRRSKKSRKTMRRRRR